MFRIEILFRLLSGLVVVAGLSRASLAQAEQINDAPKEKYYFGAMIGDPIGFTGKMKVDTSNSVDAALASSNGRWPGLEIHGDYLWDPSYGWETTQGPIFLYYGAGARMISANDKADNGKIVLGPRASIGVTYNLYKPNLEFFGEGGMILDIAPDVDVDIDLDVGVRVRF